MRRHGKWVGCFVLWGVLCGCGDKSPATAPPSTAPAPVGRVDEVGEGLTFVLGEGVEKAEAAAPGQPAAAVVLDDAATERILARLKPLPAAEDKAFALRAGSPPAPRTGKTVNQTFPPPASAPSGS